MEDNTKKLILSRLKKLEDDEIIARNYCPECVKQNKLVKLKPAGSCFDCIECGFNVCH